MDKFRTRMFVSGRLTVTGELVVPYTTTTPTQTANGAIAIGNVGGSTTLYIRSAGSIYTVSLPTLTANGTIKVTSAAA